MIRLTRTETALTAGFAKALLTLRVFEPRNVAGREEALSHLEQNDVQSATVPWNVAQNALTYSNFVQESKSALEVIEQIADYLDLSESPEPAWRCRAESIADRAFDMYDPAACESFDALIVMAWEALDQEHHDQPTGADHEDDLIAAATAANQRVRDAEHVLDEATKEVIAAVAAARTAGITGYRLHQILGRSESTIARWTRTAHPIGYTADAHTGDQSGVYFDLEAYVNRVETAGNEASGTQEVSETDWLDDQYRADVKAMDNAAHTAFEEKDKEGEAAVTAACWVHRNLRWPERDTDDLRRAFMLAGGLPTHPDTLSPDEQQEMLRRARDAAVRWNKRQGKRHDRLRKQTGVNEDLLREVENDLLDIVRLLDRAAQGQPVTPGRLPRGRH